MCEGLKLQKSACYNDRMATILIIEDEPKLVEVLALYLEREGYAVNLSSRGDDGLARWEQNGADLVILDLNLPGLDGLEVARRIRKRSDVPIMMLTARVEELDRVIGLELGADDYITKPFSPREVVARVKAVLRRAGTDARQQPEQPITIGELVIDKSGHRVLRSGVEVELTPTEFSLLAALASQPGRVFSRLQLLESAQGTTYEGYERTIDAHIKNLRAKLEPDARNPRYIETVFGVGYRFRKEA